MSLTELRHSHDLISTELQEKRERAAGLAKVLAQAMEKLEALEHEHENMLQMNRDRDEARSRAAEFERQLQQVSLFLTSILQR